MTYRYTHKLPHAPIIHAIASLERREKDARKSHDIANHVTLLRDMKNDCLCTYTYKLNMNQNSILETLYFSKGTNERGTEMRIS